MRDIPIKNIRKKKEKQVLPAVEWWKQRSVLSEKEAKEMETPLKECLADYSEYADEWIWYQTGSVEKIPIWSDGDDDEYGALARAILRTGKRSPAWASVARGVVASDDYITMGVFVGPRMLKTYMAFKNAPKKEKQTRSPRRERLSGEAVHEAAN